MPTDSQAHSTRLAEVSSAALTDPHQKRRAALQKRHRQNPGLNAASAWWSSWIGPMRQGARELRSGRAAAVRACGLALAAFRCGSRD